MPLLEGEYPIDGCNIARSDRITIEDAKLIWLNFSGNRTEYNAQGDRNFNIHLTEEQANALAADGWNVKCKPARKEDPDSEERCVLKVNVNFAFKPPRVVMVGSVTRKETLLDEELIGLLDDADIKTCDVSFVPYFWDIRDNVGVSAYLRTLYVEVVEDELELKWSNRNEDE
jgi:hypothetical protein